MLWFILEHWPIIVPAVKGLTITMAEIGEGSLEAAELIFTSRLDHGLDGFDSSADMRDDCMDVRCALNVEHAVGESNGPT